eukprot:TRINITY_DN3619_c0_g1_i1.p1 TRINITY_DN3619_c0_g1~~TRINITY_DN3619_c0_g1_i1.p1  ORF type:complete len:171 (+),score=59.56 TRINITY_DN3619_c0_g1_i1:287-799(+)
MLAEWQKAYSEHERLMGPLEQAIAEHIKKQIGTAANTATGLLCQFGKFEQLLKKPRVASALLEERRALLSSLYGHATTITSQFENISPTIVTSTATQNEVLDASLNVSPVVGSLLWGHGLVYGLQSIVDGAGKLLNDLSDFGDFKKVINDAIESIKHWCHETFEVSEIDN